MEQCKGLGPVPATVSTRTCLAAPAALSLFFSASLLAPIQTRRRTRCLSVAPRVNQMACCRIVFSGEMEGSDASLGHMEELGISASFFQQTEPPPAQREKHWEPWEMEIESGLRLD